MARNIILGKNAFMLAVGTYRITDKQIVRKILAYQNIILVFFILGKLAFFTPKLCPVRSVRNKS